MKRKKAQPTLREKISEELSRTKKLELVLTWISENETEFLNNIKDCGFDYPDYGGMPEVIYKELESDHVDLIQSLVEEFVEF